jgi:hypothetical protein
MNNSNKSNSGGDLSTFKKMKQSNGSSKSESESDPELNEIECLRQHIISCRTISSSSRAVTCTIAALDAEREKIYRDLRLKQLFSKQNDDKVVVHKQHDPTIRTAMELVHPTKSSTTAVHANDDDDDVDDDEWQAIAHNTNNDILQQEEQHMGTLLVQTSITSLAENNVIVTDPVSLLAVAIHALLRSDILAFQCTGIGIPPTTTATTTTVSGFAPPIRELPKTVFLPMDWDLNSTTTTTDNNNIHSLGNVTFRYRKKDMDKPTILRVSLLPTFFYSNDYDDNDNDDFMDDDNMILVSQYVSTNNNNKRTTFQWERMPCKQLEQFMVQIDFGSNDNSNLLFPLGRHVNVASLKAAITSQGRNTTTTTTASVPPALHYKSLSTLLLTFLRTFDLGNVYDTATTTTTTAAAATPISMQKNSTNTHTVSSTTTATIKQTTTTASHDDDDDDDRKNPQRWYDPGTTRRVDDALLLKTRNGGDFAGDLFTPNNRLLDPSRPFVGGGNLMGPNHPMFTNPPFGNYNEHDDTTIIGGLGMHPRFDPYGPPGGPTDPSFVNPGKRGTRGHGRGGTGNPNPDHLRPPQGFGDDHNMFS